MKYLVLLLVLFTSFAHANHCGKTYDHMSSERMKESIDSEKVSKTEDGEVSDEASEAKESSEKES